MKVINDQAIDLALDKMNDFSEQEYESLIEQFTEKQGDLLDFLLTDEEEFDQNEKEIILFIGMQLWYIFQQEDPNLPSVEYETVDRIMEQNEKMLEYFSEESEEDFMAALNGVVDQHAQSDLLKFIIMAIIDNEDVREENSSVAFIYLKTFVECFLEEPKKA
ncbi:MAG: hypothetical protein EAZ97_02865 [Bacteroidetes bacterium]|nr:MAG: hypothetical protein EAZ97_02865 [Bacteroidota bacterium]